MYSTSILVQLIIYVVIFLIGYGVSSFRRHCERMDSKVRPWSRRYIVDDEAVKRNMREERLQEMIVYCVEQNECVYCSVKLIAVEERDANYVNLKCPNCEEKYTKYL